MLNRTAFSEESNAAAITTPRMEFHLGQYPSDSASKQPFDANQSTPNELRCRTRWGAFSLRSKKLTLFVHALFGRTRLNRSGTETLASQPPGTTTTSNFSASTMLLPSGMAAVRITGSPTSSLGAYRRIIWEPERRPER